MSKICSDFEILVTSSVLPSILPGKKVEKLIILESTSISFEMSWGAALLGYFLCVFNIVLGSSEFLNGILSFPLKSFSSPYPVFVCSLNVLLPSLLSSSSSIFLIFTCMNLLFYWLISNSWCWGVNRSEHSVQFFCHRIEKLVDIEVYIIFLEILFSGIITWSRQSLKSYLVTVNYHSMLT